MNKTTKEIYQENQIITESINKIMEEASTDREVLSRLRNLKTSTQTQLARSQIESVISWLVSGAFFIISNKFIINPLN